MKKNCIWGKRRRLPVILAACAAEVIVAGGVGLAGGAQRAASLPTQINPAAQVLLDQSIQALGGQAFIDFKTMTSEGRVFSIADGVLQGFVHYTSAEEFPDRRRLSYGLSKKSKAVTLINNGDNGWELDRYGTIQQPQKEIRAWRLANRYSLENLLRLRIREPGMLIQMGKQDFVDNLPVQIVEMADARQAQIKLYLNISTHLPLQIGYRILDAQTHQWNEYSDIYSDYQTVQGTQTAMHIIRYLNGDRVAETFRSEVRYNETYPASFFGDQGGR